MSIVSALVNVDLVGSQVGAIGIASPQYTPRITINDTFTNGVASALQLDRIGSALVTMTGSNVDFDIRGGGLMNANNVAIDPAQIVMIAIRARAANTADITVTTTMTNGWQAMFNGIATISPGGLFLMFHRVGKAATGGTADLIRFNGTNTHVAEILVYGRSSVFTPA